MDDDKVDQQSAAVADMAAAWPVIDALVGGTLAMRKAGKQFLPQWPKEDDDSYKERLGTAVLFPSFARTSEVLSAKPFARPIKAEKVSAKVKAFFPNIDMLGTDLHAFSGQVMLACMRHGIHGILVDNPKVEGVKTVADEKKAGVRPYFTHYPAASILGWRAQRSAGGMFLTQLRLKEEVTESDGRFGETIVEQVRVLEPGKWEVWRRAKAVDGAKPTWEKIEDGTTTIKVIPFVFFYGLREGFGIGRPPLLELAHMNVEHWQSSSDQQTILHVARVPILFGKGFGAKDKIVVGSKTATMTSSEKAELKYVEHTGAAIEAGQSSIHDLEDRMREVGAELLTERQGEVTAQQVNSEDEDNRSTMQKIAEEFEDSLEACIKLMGLWIGEKTEPEVEVYKDFSSADLSGKTGDLLMSAVEKKIVSKQTAREHLKRADVLAHDLDEDEEVKRLEAERQSDIADQAERTKATAKLPPA
jgi:hypothetical protein